MTSSVRFSWRAILLAPMLVPLIVALALAQSPGPDRLFSFFLFFLPGCVISYGVTLLLFLPGLFVLSRFAPLTAGRAALLGLLVGLAIYFPIGWQSYLITGDNSGRPSRSFTHYLWHDSWSESWIFCLGGLVTAIGYWHLARPPAGNKPVTR